MEVAESPGEKKTHRNNQCVLWVDSWRNPDKRKEKNAARNYVLLYHEHFLTFSSDFTGATLLTENRALSHVHFCREVYVLSLEQSFSTSVSQ